MSVTINTKINGQSVSASAEASTSLLGISPRYLGNERQQALLQHRRVRRLHDHL